MSGFLPDNYTPPVQGGLYTKLQDGENHLRILSSAIVGYVYWSAENKPVRSKGYPEKMDNPKIRDGQPDRAKHFWAFTVYNYEVKSVQVMEVTQASIREPLLALAKSTKWGDPKEYDITVTKEGEGLDTKYSVIPDPKEAISDEIKKAYESVTVNLEALYEGADPFKAADSVTDEDWDIVPKNDNPFND